MKILKFLPLLVLLIISVFSLKAQSYNQERTKLAMFIERMYRNEPFEGCRIVDDYERSYILSVVLLDKRKYQSEVAMNRVAQVKSQRNAGEYFNGSATYSTTIIRTPDSQSKGERNMTEVMEQIESNTSGYVQQMQLLTAFDMEDNQRVFIYYKEVK